MPSLSILLPTALTLTLLLLLNLTHLPPPTTAHPAITRSHDLPPPSTPPTCTKTYGTALTAPDCLLALARLPASALIPNTNPTIENIDFYSPTNNPPARFQLPQASTVGDCSVFVDALDPMGRVWWDVGEGVGAVIRECVEKGRGVGGRVVEGGFFMAVLKARGTGGTEAMGGVRFDLCVARREAFVLREAGECAAEGRAGVGWGVGVVE